MKSQAHSVFGGMLFLVGAALLVHSFDAHYEGMGIGANVGPMYYPRILLWLWCALSLVLVVQPLLGREKDVPSQRWLPLAGIVVLVSAGAILMTVIGFLFSTILFCVSASLFMGYRRIGGLLLTGIGFPLGTWYLFQEVLLIPLPVSPWFSGV